MTTTHHPHHDRSTIEIEDHEEEEEEDHLENENESAIEIISNRGPFVVEEVEGAGVEVAATGAPTQITVHTIPIFNRGAAVWIRIRQVTTVPIPATSFTPRHRRRFKIRAAAVFPTARAIISTAAHRIRHRMVVRSAVSTFQIHRPSTIRIRTIQVQIQMSMQISPVRQNHSPAVAMQRWTPPRQHRP